MYSDLICSGGMRRMRQLCYSFHHRGTHGQPATTHSSWALARRARCRRPVTVRSKAPDHTAVDLKIPEQLAKAAFLSTEAWFQQSINDPLFDDETQLSIHLLGVNHFSPHQSRPVEQLIHVLQPCAVAIEQAPDAASQPSTSSDLPSILLPYPPFIQVLLEHWNALPASNVQHDSWEQPSEQQQQTGASDAQSVVAALHECTSSNAKVGKDIFDPFETFGWYPGLDYAIFPRQPAVVFQAFGFMPGQEYAAAVRAAEAVDAQVLCIDAPLKLQEVWVRDLLQGFNMREQDLVRQLYRELEASQAMLPAGFMDWDIGLSQQAKPLADQELSMATYKVARAVAAATLDPETSVVALNRQALLQPLKFRHFERRALHLAQQLRELCCRQRAAGRSSRSLPADGVNSGRPTARPVVAVIGRQYIPILRKLWKDKDSVLWRGTVPKSFAPSMLEPLAPGSDPDVDHGGSRPLGQKPKTLADLFPNQQPGGPDGKP